MMELAVYIAGASVAGSFVAGGLAGVKARSPIVAFSCLAGLIITVWVVAGMLRECTG